MLHDSARAGLGATNLACDGASTQVPSSHWQTCYYSSLLLLLLAGSRTLSLLWCRRNIAFHAAQRVGNQAA